MLTVAAGESGLEQKQVKLGTKLDKTAFKFTLLIKPSYAIKAPVKADYGLANKIPDWPTERV